MALRIIVFIIAGAEALIWLAVVYGATQDSDPMGEGMAMALAVMATGLFALTGLPALILAIRGKALKVALALSLVLLAIIVSFFGTQAGWFRDDSGVTYGPYIPPP